MASGDHSPLDHHLALCEALSSRLRVPCISELIIQLLLEVDDDDVTKFLDEYHEGRD